ncbi:MAG: hypothetical protein LC689_22690 [Myxococcales bacterium]|nr:hypothetical protein [Myxococcales bacterium]
MLLSVAAAIACGTKGTDRPRDVRASATAAGVDVTWSGNAGSYRVQLVDLDTGRALSDAVSVKGTHAVVPGAFSQSAGVWVDAVPGGRAVGFVSAGASGGGAQAWQMFGPQDFRDGVLHADFPQLATGERLGVLLVNAGGRDGADVDVRVNGVAETGLPATGYRPPALLAADRRSVALHAPEFAVPARVATAEAAPAGDHRAFCVVPGLDFSRHIRKAATRVAQSEHGDFWVDDEDLSHYEAPFFDALVQEYEQRVWPADTSTFGAPTDVDKNGRILVLLTHELGAHLNGGWLIGYFGNGDLLNARDDSSDCSGGGSNHAEIVYLNDVRNGGANGYSAQDLQGTVYPATLAHEFQHLLNLGHRCVEQKCDGAEVTWVNEALSKVAEDLAGYGWNSSIGRSEGAAYLERGAYDGRSLTRWEGDPIGNYQGVHSFLRFFADRLGTEVAGAIERGEGGVEGIEDALRRPLPRAMAEWASALLVSNESGAAYNFSGDAWSPLHQRLRHLEYRSPGPASLRADGIAAFVSGEGTGAPAQVTVRSAEQLPPHVVVLRVPGDLPAD